MQYDFEPYGDLVHDPHSRIYIDRNQILILGENLAIPKAHLRTHRGIIQATLDLTHHGRVESRVVHDFVREALFIRRVEG